MTNAPAGRSGGGVVSCPAYRSARSASRYGSGSSGIGTRRARPAIGGNGTQVSYGFLNRGVKTETIAVGQVQWQDETWPVMGNRTKEENYTLALYVWVAKPGMSQRQATERVFALLAEVELLLREQPFLSGAALIEFQPVSVTEAPSREGYQAFGEAQVQVKARK